MSLGWIRPATLATVALAALLPVERSAPAEPARVAPRLTLTAPRGGQTQERVVTIRGTCAGVKAERLTLVLNGIPLSIPRNGDGFESPQVLAPGLNTIRVLAAEPGGVVEDSVALYARVPAKDLRVTLTWDTPGTDVDLWVTGPDGEKVFYGHRNGSLGGSLDTDVTTGFGPETFTVARLFKGAWRIQAHYYGGQSYGGPTPTWIEVNVIEREGQADEARRIFRGLLVAAGDVLEVGEVLASR